MAVVGVEVVEVVIFQVIQGAEYVVLDVGRAHNLWKMRNVGIE